MPFNLDPSLKESSFFICELEVAQLRLVNDSRYPWVLLIPRMEGLSELMDLPLDKQQSLIQEIYTVSCAFKKLFCPDKLNIATLGNIVAQLHIHIIARYKNDAAWPKPIWAIGEPIKYSVPQADKLIEDFRKTIL